MKNTLKIAGILTLFSAIIFLIPVITGNFGFLLNWWILLVLFICVIVILIIAGRKFLRNSHVPVTYGSALKDLFIAMLISSIVSLIISVGLYRNNEEMRQSHYEFSVESAVGSLETLMGWAGESESAIEIEKDKFMNDDKGLQDIKDNYPYTWSKLPLGLLNSIFMGLIYCLIAAIFVKEKID